MWIFDLWSPSFSLSFSSSQVQSTSPWLGQLGRGMAVWCRFSSLSPACTADSCWWYEKRRPSHSCGSTGTSQWSGRHTSSPSGGSTLRSVGDMKEGGREKSYTSIRPVPNLGVWTPSRGHKRINKIEKQKKIHPLLHNIMYYKRWFCMLALTVSVH